MERTEAIKYLASGCHSRPCRPLRSAQSQNTPIAMQHDAGRWMLSDKEANDLPLGTRQDPTTKTLQNTAAIHVSKCTRRPFDICLPAKICMEGEVDRDIGTASC